jgi:hypothetical protein
MSIPMSTKMTTNYPRDLVGYGRDVPQAQWPGKAKIAIQFVLNYEEGGENSVLHGDKGSEQFLSEIIGAAEYEDRHLRIWLASRCLANLARIRKTSTATHYFWGFNGP